MLWLKNEVPLQDVFSEFRLLQLFQYLTATRNRRFARRCNGDLNTCRFSGINDREAQLLPALSMDCLNRRETI